MGNRFLIIGGGKMGEAMLAGWLSSDRAPADAITPDRVEVADPGRGRRAYLEATYGVACVPDAAQATCEPDVVVLAVKPQVMPDVLGSLVDNAPFAGDSSVLYVSIAAGLSTASLQGALPDGASLVRVMPNLPLSIGAGASAVCAGAAATPQQLAYVRGLFSCLGEAVVVDETQIDAVCALSGSGPAYVAAMIEALRDAACRQGLDSVLAEKLALQTVLGTARLIDETNADIAELRESVCSPGGTTIAALDAMHAAGFDNVFEAGVIAAVNRSKELAQCS